MNQGRPITLFNEHSGAYVLHFSKFPGGASDAINRIPNGQAAIYFWYRSFNYPSSKEMFSKYLKADLVASKFPTRTGFVKPYYEVSIGSSCGISPNKLEELDYALENEKFREHLRKLLDISIMFQAPLYIGKSKDVRQRVETHLSEGSPLRERFDASSIQIQNTALLVIPMEEDIDLGSIDDELIYEEVFSRLFNPIFNLRLG
jgi:hypothetical protein